MTGWPRPHDRVVVPGKVIGIDTVGPHRVITQLDETWTLGSTFVVSNAGILVPETSAHRVLMHIWRDSSWHNRCLLIGEVLAETEQGASLLVEFNGTTPRDKARLQFRKEAVIRGSRNRQSTPRP